MSIRDCSILGLVLMGAQVVCAGQNPPAQGTDTSRSTPAPALSGVMGIDPEVTEEDTSSGLPQIPSLLGGPGASLAFPSEQERSNYLRGGLNVGAAYDDNALLAADGGVGNTSYSVFPNVALEQTLPRLRWSLGYAAGLTVNQRFSDRNQGSHSVSLESQFRLSPHVNLRVAEDFSLATGAFDSGNPTGTGGPNASLITPLARQRSSSTVAQMNYHFALNDVVGTSGSFYDLHFSDAPALADTRSAAGSAFWLHRIFRGDWAGVSYRFDRLTFNPGDGDTRVHSFLAVNSFTLTDRFTITAFVGPEYSDNQGLPGQNGGEPASQFTDWSLAAGVDAGWHRARTSVAAGYARRINDGGGVLGAVRAQSVHADVRQELFPGWTTAFGVSYGKNKSLTVPVAGAGTAVDLTSFRASLERNLGRSFGLRLNYVHDYQKRFGVSDPPRDLAAHRNTVSLTLSYQWAKPLGR